jgi:hypothetical protein
MRARACLKCKKYVLIIPDNYQNQKILENFEKKHRGHTIVTVNEDEVNGFYDRE